MMYEWDDEGGGVIIQAMDEAGRVVDEVFLQGDDATQFRREINRAGQKELSKRCNPHGYRLRQLAMHSYFIGRLP
jgi:hypothetical protein